MPKSTKTDSISYRKGGDDLDLDQVLDLFTASTLSERRPMQNRKVMQAMLDQADLIITAWSGDELVGIARSLTDFSYVAYLADLAVHQDFQKLGIGKELIEQTRRNLERTCMITLLSAPLANEYYPKLGFTHHPRAWNLAPEVDPDFPRE